MRNSTSKSNAYRSIVNPAFFSDCLAVIVGVAAASGFSVMLVWSI